MNALEQNHALTCLTVRVDGNTVYSVPLYLFFHHMALAAGCDFMPRPGSMVTFELQSANRVAIGFIQPRALDVDIGGLRVVKPARKKKRK